MKRIFTFVFALFMLACVCFSKAQTPMPNGGFETWADTVTCDSWNSNNLNLGLFTFNFVSQTTDKHSGTYAAKVKTMNAMIQVMPGIITLGTYNLLTGPAGGYGITGKPTTVNGFYKYAPIAGDTMAIMVVLTKWNTGTSSRDTLAVNYYAVANTVASYTAFSIPLTYTPPTATPDTVNILGISSAGYAPQEGSTLYLDDLSFVYGGAGIEDYTLTNITVFPNPAVDQITISLNNGLENTIEIINMLGETVHSQLSSAQFESIDVTSFNEGMYFVRITNTSGKVSSKILISR